MRIRFIHDPTRPAQLRGPAFLPMLFDIFAQQQQQAEQRAAIARQDAELARIEAQNIAEQKRIDAEAKAAIQQVQAEAKDKLGEANLQAQQAYANRKRMNRLLAACEAKSKRLGNHILRMRAEAERGK